MSRYTPRVELHKANDGDYERVHATMEEEFTRTITTEKKTFFQLPTADVTQF